MVNLQGEHLRAPHGDVPASQRPRDRHGVQGRVTLLGSTGRPARRGIKRRFPPISMGKSLESWSNDPMVGNHWNILESLDGIYWNILLTYIIGI